MKILPKLTIALALLQMCLPSIARADGLVQMPPSSRWEIDYSKDNCALRRSFADGADQVNLEMRSFLSADSFEVIVASKRISRTHGQVRTRFDPDSVFYEPRDVEFLEAPGIKAVRFGDSIRPYDLKKEKGRQREWPDNQRDERERAITDFTIEGASSQTLQLQVGSMAKPMAALRNCLDDLLKQFGVDPVTQRSLSQKAKPVDQMAWARRTQQYLPAEIVRAGGGGFALLRLIVDLNGEVTACSPLRSAGAPEFPKYACDTALKYFHYEPAMDAHGKPVSSAIMIKSSYQI